MLYFLPISFINLTVSSQTLREEVHEIKTQLDRIKEDVLETSMMAEQLDGDRFQEVMDVSGIAVWRCDVPQCLSLQECVTDVVSSLEARQWRHAHAKQEISTQGPPFC